MAIDKRIFTGGIDRDSDERLIKNGDYRYALNIRNVSSDGDEIGTVQNVKGNTLVTYVLPAGNNSVVGSTEYPADNTVYYFVWNSTGAHSIIEYNTITQALVRVLQNAILNFNRDFLISSANVIRMNKSDADVPDVLGLSQKLLYWTDDNERPRKININKAILHSATDYVNGYSERLNDGDLDINTVNGLPEREIYIDAVKYAPTHRPTFSFTTDTSRAVNDIRKKMFQFKYRYIYDDGERSAWSPISDVTTSDIESFNRVFNYYYPMGIDNQLNIIVQNGIDTITKIEVAAREGNDGTFFLISVTDNIHAWFSAEDTAADRVQSTQTIAFYNDKLYQAIDPNDDKKLYDNVPHAAKAQEIAGSRINYGNYVDGFDLIPTQDTTPAASVDDNFNVHLSPLYKHSEELINSVTPIIFESNSYGTYNHYATTPIYSVFSGGSFGFYVHVPFGQHPPTKDSYYVLDIAMQTKYNTGTYDWWNLKKVFLVTSDDTTAADVAEGDTNSFFNQLNNTTLIGQSNLTYTITCNMSSTDTLVIKFECISSDLIGLDSMGSPNVYNNSFVAHGGLVGPTFKSGANHDLGIIYYDEADRSSTVNKSIDSSIFVDFPSQRKVYSATTDNARGRTDCFWAIMHRPPDWATHYQWVYSGNTSVLDFVQLVIRNRWRDKDNKIYLDLSAIKSPESPPPNIFDTDVAKSYQSKGAVIDIEPAKGDRIRFISYITPGNENTVNTMGPAYGIFTGAGDEGDRHYFNTIYDFEIVDVVYDPEIPMAVTTMTAPPGATPDNWTYKKEGTYVVIEDPGVDGFRASDFGVSYDYPVGVDYNVVPDATEFEPNEYVRDYYLNAVVEIYRPQKTSIIEEAKPYYEFSDLYEIANPGTAAAFHMGESTTYRDQDGANGAAVAFQELYTLQGSNFSGTGGGWLHLSVNNSHSMGLREGDAITFAGTGNANLDDVVHIVGEIKGNAVSGGQTYNVVRTQTHLGELFTTIAAGTGRTVRRLNAATGKFSKGDVYFKPTTLFMGGKHKTMPMAFNYQGLSFTDLLELTVHNQEVYQNQERTFYMENYYFNDFYKSDNYDKGRPHFYIEYARQIRRPSSITYSEGFTVTGVINGLSNFNLSLANFKDFDDEYSSIQKISKKNDYILIFQEDKVSKVLINKSIITSASGEEMVSLTTDYFSEQSPYGGGYGISRNPESHVRYNNRDYFVDIKRGAVLRLSQDGITKISDYGMLDYFADLGNDYMSLVNDLKIIGGFDPRYNEYIIAFQKLKYSKFIIASTGKETDTSIVIDKFTDPDVDGDKVHIKVPIEIDSTIVNPFINTTGTISISNGSATLNGSGTLFLRETNSGDIIYQAGQTTPIGTVSTINSNTQITLASTYSGTTLSGVSAIAIDGSKNRVSSGREISLQNIAKGNKLSVSRREYSEGTLGNTLIPAKLRVTNDDGTTTDIDSTIDLSGGIIVIDKDDAGYKKILVKKGITLAFSEPLNRWVTFYSYEPDYMSKLNNELYSFKDGEFYIHDSNETRNNFYDTQYVSKLDVVANTSPSNNKIYSSIALEGTHSWDINDIRTNLVETTEVELGQKALNEDSGSYGENIKGVGNISTVLADATVTGTNTEFTTSLVVGDILRYQNTELGEVAVITNNTSLELTQDATVALVNMYCFVQASSSEFADKEGIFYASLKYANINTFGGITDKGTNLFGLGDVSIVNGQTALTGTNFDTNLKIGDIVRFGDGGALIGTINAVTNATTAVLEVAYPGATLTNQYAYIEETSVVEGDRFRGYYIRANMESDAIDKMELFAIGFYATQSELSNR